jgi:methyl-accepting chemotaxis protein
MYTLKISSLSCNDLAVVDLGLAMFNLNIRQKVVITTLFAVSLSVAVVSVFSIKSISSVIVEGLKTRELPAALGEVANNLDAQLLLPITVSRTMANNVGYQAFIRNGEQVSDVDNLANSLSAIKQEFNTIAATLVSVKTGNYYNDAGLFKSLSRNNDKDQWFYHFLNSGKEYELSLDIDENTQLPTLFINYLMKVDGQAAAVVGVGLSLKAMSETIKSYRLGENGIVFLVDNQGIIKLHQNSQLIGMHFSTIAGDNVKQLLSNNTFSSVELTHNDNDLMLTSRTLPRLKWTLVAQLPLEQVYGALNETTWMLVVIGLVIAVFFVVLSGSVINKLISPFSELAKLLEKIGEGGGDLTKRLDDSQNDETGRMAKGYNNFVCHLSELLQQVSNTGHALFTSIERIDSQANNMEAEIKEQVIKVEQIATAMHEMGMSAQEIANSANSAAESANLADDTVQQGDQSVQQTISSVTTMSAQLQATSETIKQLAEDANSIDTVLDVIRSVSEQTNLLALNAAIEAARAGDQGRGFAVVADEVRTLASRSQDSAEEIRTIIEKLQVKTQDAVHSISQSTNLSLSSQDEASQSGAHLQNISENISVMSDMNIQIATATTEQSNVVDEINPHVKSIQDITRTSSAALVQTANDCRDLRALAEQLNVLVSRFKFT